MRRNFTRALVTRAALALQQRSAAAADDVSWGLGDDEEIISPPKGATTPLSQAQPSPALPAGARPVAVSAARAKAPRNDDDDLDPEWQRIDATELSSRIVLYLNTCRAPHFISEPLEKQMFTTLVARQKELHLDQLLDLVEVRWPAPTQERYFTLVSDLTRNRIVADTEAFIKEAADAAAASFAERMESGSASPIPQTGPTALLLARCIVVMGIRGRRRRDLELFKPLGRALALRINDIRDPHTLCYALIAFQSARIKPPSQFLGLVGRRLPVLNKKFPISPLPAYRALMFYDKSDYELMNPYRFLADRIMAHIKNELQREGAGGDFIEPRVVTPVGGPIRRAADGDDDDLDDADFALLRGLQRNETQAEPEAAPAPRMIKKKPAAAATAVSPAPEAPEDVPAVPDSATNTARRSDSGEASLDSAMPDYALKPDFAVAEETKAANLLDRGPQTDPLVEISDRRRVRERFHRITQLKPPQLTRMLYVLARRFAPRQQYLRPIANDVLIPSMEHFNPPSFSRLVRSVRHFQSEELNLLEAIVDIMCKRGADAVPLGDVLELLHLFSRPNVPLAKADKFFKLCEDMFKDSSKLRPRDALSITSELLLIRKLKFEDSDSGAPPAGTSIAPLQSLLSVVDSFAFRFAAFLELGVLALPNADALLDMGNQLEKGREPSPAMSRLLSARQAAVAEGEEAYHDLLDVDVREIFFRIQVVNSHLTHRGFRPLPANVMQEFKAMLDYMRADFILEAVHVYAQAYPGALSVPVRRVLGAFIVDKLKLELDVAMGKIAPPPPPPQPEMVAVEGDIDGHRRLFKPYDVTKPKYSPMLFTPASLTKFGNIVMATPLQRVLRSEATWRYLELKARQFKNDGLREIVIERLAAQKEEEAARELREMRGEVTAEGLKDQQEAFL